MSREDIIYKVERALSEILSDKYEAKIKIKFKRGNKNVNGNKGRDIRKKQILDR